MEYESEIKRLEDIVERLLEGYTGLKAEIKKKEQEVQAQQNENDQLRQQVEAENDQLRQQVEAMESERGDLGGRVSSLIDRIEIWESELEVAEFDSDDSDDLTDELDSIPEKSEEHIDDQDDDSAGGVQGSLFTASSTT